MTLYESALYDDGAGAEAEPLQHETQFWEDALGKASIYVKCLCFIGRCLKELGNWQDLESRTLDCISPKEPSRAEELIWERPSNIDRFMGSLLQVVSLLSDVVV